MTLDWIDTPPKPREEPEPAARVPFVAPAPAAGGRARPSLRARLRRQAERARAAPGIKPSGPADLWVPLGPAAVLYGQAELRPRIAGRARSLSVSPDGQRAYVGTAQGGTWFSSDFGRSWLALDFYATTRDLTGALDESNALAVGAIAVRYGGPRDGSQDVVYVGTGERRHEDLNPLPAAVQGVGIRVATGPGPTVLTGGPETDPWTLEATDLAGATVLRIVLDDATGEAWALTSKGLFKRPAGGGGAWVEILTGLPKDFLLDAVVTRGEGSEARRLYLACSVVIDGKLQMAWSAKADSAADWHLFELPAFPGVGAQPADVKLARGNDPDHAVVYAVADRRRMWRVQGDKAQRVVGIPAKFVQDQAGYDLAIAVHPSTAAAARDRIVIGGAAAWRGDDTDWNAELFTGKVTNAGAVWSFAPSYVGPGVHPDVHDIAWVPGDGSASQIWVACDGGVFRSDKDGALGSFAARNTGIANLEAQYLAQHPASDALVYVGTQDNGAVRRVGAETWALFTEGDAGGMAVDPLDPRNVIAQYIQSGWNVSPDGGRSSRQIRPFRAPPSTAGFSVRKQYLDAADGENGACPMYCSAAVVAAGSATRLAIGTDRVWLTTDWGKNWVTLPSATDPYHPTTPGAPNRTQDQLPGTGAIVTLKWGDADHLYVVSFDGIHHLALAGTTWSRSRLYDRPAVATATGGGAPPAGQIPPDLPVTDIAPHDRSRGPHGSLYAATSGVGRPNHVWWFDGTSTWFPAGIHVEQPPPFDLDSPVHALVVDPDHPEVVYAGSDVGVWKGTATFPPGGGAPSWKWVHFSNGLPEASCIDLVIHRPTRLLRAALRGRGVWEVALDGAEETGVLYLRAHDFDTRRRPVPPTGAPDPLGDPKSPLLLRLDASPDVRVFRAPGSAAPPAPLDLPLSAKSNPFDLWALQAARRAAGVRTPVDGSWSRATIRGMRPLPTTADQWDKALGGPKSNTPPFDHDPPDAADVAANLRDEPDRRGGPTASCVTGDGPVRVYVTVHARDPHPLPGADVAVCVLKTPGNLQPDLGGTPPLPADWSANLVKDIGAPLGAARGTWLAGSSWSYLDPVNPFRTLPATLHAGAPQVVTFHTTLSSPSWPANGWLLLAVFHAPEDRLETLEREVATLVRTKRHVAARSVRRLQ